MTTSLKINDHLQCSVATIAIRFERLLHLREREPVGNETSGIDSTAGDHALRDPDEWTKILGHGKLESGE